MIPRTSDMKNIFLALGISDIPFPEDMTVLDIHTMQNDKLIALFKGDEFPVLVANTFSQE